MKIPPIFRKKNAYSLIGAISSFWILTGIILLILGIWFISLYFMFEPHVAYILQNTTDQIMRARIQNTMTTLPILGGGCFLFAMFEIFTALSFRKFKKWALNAVSIVAYIMILLAGVACVAWVKMWQFVIQFSSVNSGSSFWNYFGLFIGLVAGLLYIVMVIFYIKSSSNKTFRDAYRRKMIN